MTSKVIVIGGGQAAVSFIARLRSLDQDSSVTLISEEPVLPYQRPPLSKKYATGEMTLDQLLLRPPEWYETNNVYCHLGCRVTAIDCTTRTLVASDNEVYTWDALFLATGSRPRALPSAIGGDLGGVHLLRDLADADRFAGELTPGKKAVIIGGGYIGLEAASVCAKAGVEVTLIEAADRILQRVACAETSDWFRNLHAKHGVVVREGSGVSRIEGADGQVNAVVLGDNERIDCDFVLVGIGIVPNLELAEAAKIDTANGIVVDAHCRTSDPNVYAAGDCTVFEFRGEMVRLESVQNAIDQAECAADNLCGNSRTYRPVPWFWSDQYDVKLQIAGLNAGYDRIIVRLGEREGAVSHFYYCGDQLLAVDAINDPRTYMVAKKLLEAGGNILPEQAEDRDLQLKSLL